MARTKRFQTIELFGKIFEFDTKETTAYVTIQNRSIWDCYERPSRIKESIYESWRNWFIENNGYCDVCSHNSNFFSMQGYVRNMETRDMYFCYITPAHNRCIKVD